MGARIATPIQPQAIARHHPAGAVALSALTLVVNTLPCGEIPLEVPCVLGKVVIHIDRAPAGHSAVVKTRGLIERVKLRVDVGRHQKVWAVCSSQRHDIVNLVDGFDRAQPLRDIAEQAAESFLLQRLIGTLNSLDPLRGSGEHYAERANDIIAGFTEAEQLLARFVSLLCRLDAYVLPIVDRAIL